MVSNSGTSSNGAGSNGVFPELVIDIQPSTTRQGAPALSPIGQTVTNALREVLAWRPNADAKGFVAALNQAFSINEVEGHTEFKWTPRSYAVQADMGAVTGAQASIYARAKAALDQSVPLLEGLFPLRSDADEQDTDASRAVVTGKLTDMINELGVVGGPRIPRVEDYFDSLLGRVPRDNPEEVSGLFGRMRDEFGFKREMINTIDEEQNLTNYLIVVDNVIALRRSWDNFMRGDVFLGTQLVLLSRQLAVVAESVQELYFVLDSVFLGAAERETVRLDSDLTIAELFTWVERFCTEEAPRLIREGGKDGVNSFRPTVRRLYNLIGEALQQAKKDADNPQQGFHQPRTRAALAEVHGHMRKVMSLTDQLRREPRPTVDFVAPNPVNAAKDVRVTLEGENFQEGATVYLSELVPTAKATVAATVAATVPAMVAAKLVRVLNANEIRAVFDLDQVTASDWAIVVINPDDDVASFEVFTVCGVRPTPETPTPETPTPETPTPKPFAVDKVTLYDGENEIRNTVEQDGSINVPEGTEVTMIRVAFTDNIDGDTVNLGSTVFMTALAHGEDDARFVAYKHEVKDSVLTLYVGLSNIPVVGRIAQGMELGEGTYVLLITELVKSHPDSTQCREYRTEIRITSESSIF